MMQSVRVLVMCCGIHSQNDSGDLRGVAGGDGVCVVRQAPVICVMAPPIHLSVWSISIIGSLM